MRELRTAILFDWMKRCRQVAIEVVDHVIAIVPMLLNARADSPCGIGVSAGGVGASDEPIARRTGWGGVQAITCFSLSSGENIARTASTPRGLGGETSNQFEMQAAKEVVFWSAALRGWLRLRASSFAMMTRSIAFRHHAFCGSRSACGRRAGGSESPVAFVAAFGDPALQPSNLRDVIYAHSSVAAYALVFNHWR